MVVCNCTATAAVLPLDLAMGSALLEGNCKLALSVATLPALRIQDASPSPELLAIPEPGVVGWKTRTGKRKRRDEVEKEGEPPVLLAEETERIIEDMNAVSLRIQFVWNIRFKALVHQSSRKPEYLTIQICPEVNIGNSGL